MKKRTIALLTTLALATGMVAGCGSSNTAATDTAKTSETVSSEKTEATETVESTEMTITVFILLIHSMKTEREDTKATIIMIIINWIVIGLLNTQFLITNY